MNGKQCVDIQSISGCLSHHGKTKIQTDQSNVSYIETSPSSVNLIGQFFLFVLFFRDRTSNLKSTVQQTHTQRICNKLCVILLCKLNSTVRECRLHSTWHLSAPTGLCEGSCCPSRRSCPCRTASGSPDPPVPHSHTLQYRGTHKHSHSKSHAKNHIHSNNLAIQYIWHSTELKPDDTTRPFSQYATVAPATLLTDTMSPSPTIGYLSKHALLSQGAA